MEELNLSLEFSVLISADSAVWAHSDDILQERVHWDTLNHFLVTVKRLYLRELALRSTPENGGAIDRTRDETTGVLSPANVHNVADMASELAGVTPLDCLLLLSKFSWEKLQGPYNYHLIVWAGSQELSTRGESDYIHSGGVSTLQVIAVLRDPLHRPILLMILH